MTVRFNLEQHAVIYGKSSSGKTYLAKSLFTSTRYRAIYWNRQEERIPGVPERRAWGLPLLREPGAKVNLIPPDSTEASEALLHRIRADLFRVGRRVATDRSPLVVFFHDEPDREAPANDKESGAYDMAVRGNRHGVKYVGITQRPSQLSKSVRAQAVTKIVFALDDEEEVFLRRADVPDEVFDWVAWEIHGGTARPSYRFAVNQGAGWIKCNPWRGPAAPKPPPGRLRRGPAGRRGRRPRGAR